MISHSISVNKQPVSEFLKTGKDNPLLIPEYQRTYSWTEDHVRTLFDDIVNFTEQQLAKGNDSWKKDGLGRYYFLGTLVFYVNEDGQQEIIDGQQRLTSILLLLRAIYTAISQSSTDEAKNFVQQIEPTIWEKNDLTGQVDKNKILITSKVINDSGNLIFHNILASGIADPKAKDNYSKNYILFQEYYKELAVKDTFFVYRFINNLLNYTIFMPISADTQDTALTIFSTLNDRGLPLSDADIFKSKIYGGLTTLEDKRNFINEWQKLDERASEIGQTIQQLFYYYMFYCRALKGDSDTTTPGVRRYFANDDFAKIKVPNILETLNLILNIDAVVWKHDIIDGEPWSEDNDILSKLDILNSYPNEFGKYPIIVYYLKYRALPDFKEKFLAFLKKHISELFQRYIVRPTITEVKASIVKLNCEIVKSSKPVFDFKQFDPEQEHLKDFIRKPLNKQLTKLILKVVAYNDGQTGLLPDKWEIEHILPKAHENSYYVEGYTQDKIGELIEEIGNLMPLEKKLNIKAGDGYFNLKKAKYATSKINTAIQMSARNRWIPDDIIIRSSQVADRLIAVFNTWSAEYDA